MIKLTALFLLFLTTFVPSFAQKQDRILIAAASDLKFALDSIILVFNKTNNGQVDVTYGSSGKLFEQISNGAPFDLYYSADINYPNLLKERGFGGSEVFPYGIGRIVLWSKKIDPNTEGMKSLLSPKLRKVAIANPEHAPYGIRAMESMRYFDVLNAVNDKFVLGENISQTAQFVTTGAADIGIVALSLAVAPTMKRQGGNYFLIPETSHKPLLQGAIITSRSQENALARIFFDFVKSEKAQLILEYFGFTKP